MQGKVHDDTTNADSTDVLLNAKTAKTLAA